jgi:hypothetical protein
MRAGVSYRQTLPAGFDYNVTVANDGTLSRRTLIAGSTAMAAGFAAKSLGLSMNESPLILGSGSHRYECFHDWITPPAGMVFGDTHGVAQDAKGNIYIAHTVNGASQSDDAICVYDEKGKFIKSWGSQFKGGAHGLDIRKEKNKEFIYHCDVNHRKFIKTDLDGKVIFELDTPKESGKYGSGENFIPTNVAFSPNGDFYIADGYGSNWIHQFTINGDYIRTFGGTGSEPGKVSQPHGIWLDDRSGTPMLAVADRANRRIQYFDLDGKHIKFSTEGMRQPCHFSIRGDEMLVPDLDSVITILDKSNKPIVQLGDGAPSDLRGHPRADFIPGKFIHPHDAMFLRNGDILVGEWVPIGRVTLLKRVR